MGTPKQPTSPRRAIVRQGAFRHGHVVVVGEDAVKNNLIRTDDLSQCEKDLLGRMNKIACAPKVRKIQPVQIVAHESLGRVLDPTPEEEREESDVVNDESSCTVKKVHSTTGAQKMRIGDTGSLQHNGRLLPATPFVGFPHNTTVVQTTTGVKGSLRSSPRPVSNTTPPITLSPTRKGLRKTKKQSRVLIRKERVLKQPQPAESATDEDDFVATLRRAEYWKGRHLSAKNRVRHLEKEKEHLLRRMAHLETGVMEVLTRIVKDGHSQSTAGL